MVFQNHGLRADGRKTLPDATDRQNRVASKKLPPVKGHVAYRGTFLLFQKINKRLHLQIHRANNSRK